MHTYCTICTLCISLLYSWKFLPNSAHSHWLLWGHMTSNNETVSYQNLWAANITKSMTSDWVTVPCYPQMFTGDRRYSKCFPRWIEILRKQNYIFPLGPAIKCFWESSSSTLTQKSRLYLRFLNSPPTRAAKWITCVGLCFSKIALVAAESLQLA